MYDTDPRGVRNPTPYPFTSRSTKPVFVNCPVFEISGNSKGGQVAKRKGHNNFILFHVLLSFLVCINTDSKFQTGAALFKTALNALNP